MEEEVQTRGHYVRMMDCTDCELSCTRTQVVPGSGPLDAKLVIVGEAPGAKEDATGEAFVGSSGTFLFKALKQVLNIDRSECYVTNMVKCRPPENRTPTKIEIAKCSKWWEKEQEALKSTTVLTLGLVPSRTLLNTTQSMKSMHGVSVGVGSLNVVPTYHPASAMRNRVLRDQFMQDLQALFIHQ